MEKIYAIVGIVLLTLSCFFGIGYLGAGANAAVVASIVDAFKFAVVSLGSLATGVAVGEIRAEKKKANIKKTK